MVISELRKKYPLKKLLEIARIPSSTYKYQVKRYDYKKNKDKELLEKIKDIFEENHNKYGYLSSLSLYVVITSFLLIRKSIGIDSPQDLYENAEPIFVSKY